MTIAVIIVAAGRGRRAGGDMPKQWQDLYGKPVIARTLNAFRGVADQAVVVLNPDDMDYWETLGLHADQVVARGLIHVMDPCALGLPHLRRRRPDMC